MQAVIETGGKQYLVKENQVLRVEKLPVEEGKEMTFTPLLVTDEKGAVSVGTPEVSGGKVTVKVMEQGRAKKIRVVKYKSKIRYTKVSGHRQHFTQIKVTSITA